MKKSLNPFIKEMILSLLLLAIAVALLISQTVSIKLEANLFSIGLVVFAVILCVFSLKSVRIGAMAVIDLILKSTYTVEAKIQTQIPYECNWLSDRFDEDRHIVPAIRFCIVVKATKGKNLSLISPCYIDIPDGQKCTLLIAKHSSIIVGVMESHDEVHE